MADNVIKGITIEIGGNTGPLNKALSEVNKESRSIQNELKAVEKLLKFDPSNTDLLAQKQKLLADAVNAAKTKLDALKQAQEEVNKNAGNGIKEERWVVNLQLYIFSEYPTKDVDAPDQQQRDQNQTLRAKKFRP